MHRTAFFVAVHSVHAGFCTTQVVSYKQGQEFGLHHDAGTVNIETETVELVEPARLATFFVYLKTMPDGVGHTEFPWLKSPVSVRPEAGQAILFCNVTQDGKADAKTSHMARPVEGDFEKLGMNLWLCPTARS